MGSFHLAKMSLRNLFKQPATKMYPVVAPTYTKMTKGHVVNDIDTCILCGICEKRCPTYAIHVSKPDRTWAIEHFACIQCMSCVRACPKKCMTMLPDYTKPAATKTTFMMTKPEKVEAEAAAAVEEL